MNYQLPLSEIKSRLDRFKKRMDNDYPEWENAVIFSKINILYFTGTMPDGMLIIQRNGKETLWVRRSYERAKDDSLFQDIRPMNSYRDAAAEYPNFSGTVHIEAEFVPLAMLERFKKYFPFSKSYSLDYQVSMVRAIKSEWEMSLMKKTGKMHEKILEIEVPKILREGISEVELSSELYAIMLKEGHMGNARFNMFDTELPIAQLGFGVNSLYPSSFNGPGGHLGMYASMPSIGNHDTKLKKGDYVFVDMGVAINGYHTDKTLNYQFGNKISDEAISIHNQCVDLQYKIAEQLKPGNIPAKIYEDIINDLSPEFLQNFMGFGDRQSKFLGHAIGLHVDELPVIARGFNEPLEENMVFAIEPKKGVKGVGLMGIENTFVVTKDGGVSITGNSRGLIEVF